MEKFKKANDEPEWGILNKFEIDLNGRQFEVGIHQVIYGFRVRGGWTGQRIYEFDWCCGANKIIIFSAQLVLMNLIERGIPLKEIPRYSEVKPWFNDPEFIKHVDYLYGDNFLDTISKIFTNEKMGA